MMDRNGLNQGEAANVDRSCARTGQITPNGDGAVVEEVEVEVEVEVVDVVPVP